MTHISLSHLLWYDRLERRLETVRQAALLAGDARRARRALMLRLWANDRAEQISRLR